MIERFEVYRASVGPGPDPEVEWILYCQVNGRETAFKEIRRLLDAGLSVRLQGRQVLD